MYFLSEDILIKINKETKKEEILSITDKMNTSLIYYLELKEKLDDINKYSFSVKNGEIIDYTKKEEYIHLETEMKNINNYISSLKSDISMIEYEDFSLKFIINNEFNRFLLNPNKFKEETKVK